MRQHKEKGYQLSDGDNNAPDNQLQNPNLIVNMLIIVLLFSTITAASWPLLSQVNFFINVDARLKDFNSVGGCDVVDQFEEHVRNDRPRTHIEHNIHEVPDAAVSRARGLQEHLCKHQIQGVAETSGEQLFRNVK